MSTYAVEAAFCAGTASYFSAVGALAARFTPVNSKMGALFGASYFAGAYFATKPPLYKLAKRCIKQIPKEYQTNVRRITFEVILHGMGIVTGFAALKLVRASVTFASFAVLSASCVGAKKLGDLAWNALLGSK